MSDAFDVIIGVGIGLFLLFILLCGLSCYNNTLSATNRVQNEEDSNTPSSHPEGSFQRIERTEDL